MCEVAVAQVGPGSGAAQALPMPGLLFSLGVGWGEAPRTRNLFTFPCKAKSSLCPSCVLPLSGWQEKAEQMAPLTGFTGGVLFSRSPPGL